MYSIFKKEFASYFNALTGYLVIVLFLIITGLLCWVFPDTSILEFGYANMDSFFDIAPYLLMLLVPALTMRSIAGERSDGTYELLLSRPLSTSQIVVGKYLGSVALVVFAIIPTCIYAISIYVLAQPSGNIDVAAIIGSYLGLLLLSASYASIGMFASSVTKSPIVALLLAIAINFFYYYAFDAASSLDLFYSIEDAVRSFGAQAHYWSMSRGVMTFRDILYFLSVIAIFGIFTVGHLGKDFRPTRRTLTVYAVAILTFFILNSTFLESVRWRIDLTEDKRFTLSEISKEMVESIDEEVYITLFLDGKALPPGFQRLRNATIGMVNDLRAHAGGKIKFNIIDPLDDSEGNQEEFTQKLIDLGLFPTNLNLKKDGALSQTLIFPWAMVGYGQKEIAVNLLQNKMGVAPEQVLNNSVENVEYALVNTIRKVRQAAPAYIGFTEGHGEPSDLALYDAMQTLMSSHQVGRVNLDSIDYTSLDQLSVLVVAKPKKAFTEAQKYKIDYFVRHGGNVIWAIDQIDASLDYLRQSGRQPLVTHELKLDDMLFSYGVRLPYNLIADLHCAQIPMSVGNIGAQPQMELVPWYFYPILMPTSSHPLVKNLDGIKTEFIGTIDTLPNAAIQKTILLQSSPFTRIITPPNEISLQMVEEEIDPKKFRTTPAPTAVLFEGKFPYIFAQRPAPEGIDDIVEDRKSVV